MKSNGRTIVEDSRSRNKDFIRNRFLTGTLIFSLGASRTREHFSIAREAIRVAGKRRAQRRCARPEAAAAPSHSRPR
ncbi:hypothetical protein PT2222_280028 [Paraburkholderia tropica]